MKKNDSVKADIFKRLKRSNRSTASIIAVGFLVLITVGACLLMLPVSSRSGEFTNPMTAFFTAVSASCVTGLVVVDTGLYWSVFGQTVIIVMIQIGGLGFMTLAVLLSGILRRHISPKERMLVAMSYNLNSYGSTKELVRRILIGTFVIEGLGAAALATVFVPIFGWADGIYKSVFHSISAFCNAGFDLFGEYGGEFSSLISFSGNYVVGITVMLLIVLGGIGFIVWNDIVNYFRTKRRISVYSRFVLLITAILLFGGALLFAILEWNNPATLGGMSFGEKLMNAFFQSVTLRTAGFSMTNNALLTEGSQLLGVMLMFVGGASGSTAGGVKVATVGILFYTVYCVSVGKKRVVLFGRKLTQDSFMRAVSLVVIQLMLVFVGTAVIIYSTGFDAMAVLYEVTSAGATVGISMGLTPMMNGFSKAVLMLMMYFGRVGILSVTCAIMANLTKNDGGSISYPDANMLIG